MKKDYVRVTEILNFIDPIVGIDPVVLKNKGAIGTNVHNAILDDCDGKFCVFESERAQAYFDSYKMLDNEKYKKVIQVPRLYDHDLMITGMCDGLLDDYLIDWKCSAQASPKKWSMQAHFYHHLLKINGYSPQNAMYWINLRHEKAAIFDFESGYVVSKYIGIKPVTYKFEFDEDLMQECFDAVHLYFNALENALILDS